MCTERSCFYRRQLQSNTKNTKRWRMSSEHTVVFIYIRALLRLTLVRINSCQIVGSFIRSIRFAHSNTMLSNQLNSHFTISQADGKRRKHTNTKCITYILQYFVSRMCARFVRSRPAHARAHALRVFVITIALFLSLSVSLCITHNHKCIANSNGKGKVSYPYNVNITRVSNESTNDSGCALVIRISRWWWRW